MIAADVKTAANTFAQTELDNGFKAEALHVYQNEHRTPLFWVLRLKHPESGDKWIRPMHLNGNGYALGKPRFENGTPLYMLADIVAHPSAVIWITEGEWAADHLNDKFKKLDVFGEHIATTSSGATSARGANWQCLEGHDVRIWPDNDDAGLKYAQDVTDCLRSIRCRVQHIDVAKLDLAEKADAVDWLEARPDATITQLVDLPVDQLPAPIQSAEPDDAPRGPPRIHPLAFHGILKEIVDVAIKNSEASAVAVAANTIAFFCAMVGRAPYQWVGDSKIHCRPFFLIVGNSAKSRKGTAEKLPRRLFKKVDEILVDRIRDYTVLTVHGGGLSSGEGIGYAIRDASDATVKEGNPTDTGVPDKRLLVIESEFASVLANCRRETSTLSAVIRNLWDGCDLAPLTKNNRTRASNPHVVLIGHITGWEFVEKKSQLEISNGLLNRFLLCYVQRDKLVALPEPTPEAQINRLAEKLADAIEFATGTGFGIGDTLKVTMSQDARQLWEELYPCISVDLPGVTGALTARSEVYVRMLAMIFALLDSSTTIEPSHLRAAIHWLDYVTESTRYIFGNEGEQKALDDLEIFAQKVLAVIKDKGTATRTDINNAFHNHKTATKLNEVLDYLLTATPARIEAVKEKTRGRPSTVYRLAANKAD